VTELKPPGCDGMMAGGSFTHFREFRTGVKAISYKFRDYESILSNPLIHHGEQPRLDV